MKWTGKIWPRNLLYLFVLFKISNNHDISVSMYHFSNIYFVETWMCMNFKYLNLSHHIYGVFWRILHVQCHIISHCMDIIVLHSAYISRWMFWLLDKGISRAKTCLQCKEIDTTFWGQVTAQLYENCDVLFMWFCVSIVEFVFGVFERIVTESVLSLCAMYCNIY